MRYNSESRDPVSRRSMKYVNMVRLLTDGGDGSNYLAKLQLVQDGGFTSGCKEGHHGADVRVHVCTHAPKSAQNRGPTATNAAEL